MSDSYLSGGWPAARLGTVCDFLDARRIPVTQHEREQRTTGLSQDRLYPYYGANGQAGWIDSFLFEGPAILLAEDGGNFGSPTRPVAYAVDGQYWVNNHAHILRPKPGVVDFDFLKWALSIRPDIGSLVGGSTRGKLTQELAATVLIPLPPMVEQKRIAAKLNQQMATLAGAQAALAAQRAATIALRSAVLRTALDPATHPDWPVLPIGQVTIPGVETWNVIARPNDTKEYVEIAGIDSSSKTIASTHPIVAHAAPSRARNIIHTDDVLVATTRPNLNAVALVPDILDGQVCSTGFAVLRPGKSVLSKWLYWNVRSPRFVQMASDLVVGAMYPAVTDAQVRAICIPVPPLSQQRRIAEYLDSSMKQVDAIVASLGIQGSTLDALRTSLLDAAFGGKV